MAKYRIKLPNHPESISTDFFEDIQGIVADGIFQEFQVREGQGPYKKWIVGELAYHVNDQEAYALTRPDHQSTKFLPAQNYDIIYNPYLDRIVFDKSLHMQFVFATLYSMNGRKGVSGAHPLLTLIHESISCDRFGIHILNPDAEKFIIIGQEDEKHITFKDGTKWNKSKELKSDFLKLKYEEVGMVYNYEDMILL